MDLYTLTPQFLAKDVIDEFVSAIWSERFSVAGDFQLVVAPTAANLEKLAEGTYLALRGSKDVMVVDTLTIENGLMTVTGRAMTQAILNQRNVWFLNPASAAADSRVVDFVDKTRKPGEFISNVVDKMAINPVAFTGTWAPANLDWIYEVIPYLTLGDIDTSGVAKLLQAPIGPLYDAIAQVASNENVGIQLYLESADPDLGYSLKFKTYQGKDRTSDQSTYPLVRLLPELDSISDLKEIRSSALYKNVAYVYLKGVISIHYADPLAPIPEGLDRRSLIVTPDVAGTKYDGSSYIDPADDAAFRAQQAKDALANNNYIRAIDGQTSPISEYQYGVHYELGDTIELKGLTGLISKARITEFIRSQDESGEKSYPTISVVDS